MGMGWWSKLGFLKHFSMRFNPICSYMSAKTAILQEMVPDIIYFIHKNGIL